MVGRWYSFGAEGAPHRLHGREVVLSPEMARRMGFDVEPPPIDTRAINEALRRRRDDDEDGNG